MTVVYDRGYAAVRASELAVLGWTLLDEGASFVLWNDGTEVELRVATPFFQWGADSLQLSEPPYLAAGDLMVPLQLVVDFLPRRMPHRYSFDGPSMTLRVEGEEKPTAVVNAPEEDDGVRVVVIDAGHGGNDPGAIGVGRIREKDVALGIALAMAESLRDEPNLEVHLLREGDEFIDLWDRGALATDLKGERHGVFISIHANSFPARRSARGFETYFLSEARTDDERRVAAIENAPLRVQTGPVDPGDDLGFILRELRTLDHQHWSRLLAQTVQDEVGRVHPGTNRGVKQGPLAVITNALMPAVLIEIGFLSHAEEGPLLGQESFQKDAAGAIAEAVRRFFARYPPGSGEGA
jgi:N-acetylmuramoyl-L-alanine amidase